MRMSSFGKSFGHCLTETARQVINCSPSNRIGPLDIDRSNLERRDLSMMINSIDLVFYSMIFRVHSHDLKQAKLVSQRLATPKA